MRKLIVLLIFVLYASGIRAQNYCKKASAYFDLNKSELKPAAINNIDALLNSLPNDNYLIEIYGFADSSHSDEYNLKLSQARIAAVRKHIESKNKIGFKFLEKNLGESQAAKLAKDPSLDRRVDIFLIPIKDNKLILKGARETVELPIDYFEPCGICNSTPELNGYYTPEEAAKARIVFTSSTGEELETAGTVKFDFKPCDTERKNEMKTFVIEADKLDPGMTIWEPVSIDGITHWIDTQKRPEYDEKNKRYIVYTTMNFLNLDKPKWRILPGSAKVHFPKELENLNSHILTFKNTRADQTTEDSLIITDHGNAHKIVSIAKQTENAVLYVKDPLKKHLAKIDSNWQQLTLSHIYIVPLSAYKEFGLSDTAMKIKFSKRQRPDEIGFYIAEIDEFIPLQSDKKGKYFLKKPAGNYPLAIVKKKKLYVLDEKKASYRYSKRKNRFTSKFNSKNNKAFKINKNYPQTEKQK